MSKEAKLAALRAKTDVELVRHISNELELGVRLASESGHQSRIRAEEAYAEIVKLLPVIRGLGEAERRRWEARIERLRGMLDQMPALTRTAV
jgi:hypothetical protein